jgi:hypothetical protein
MIVVDPRLKNVAHQGAAARIAARVRFFVNDFLLFIVDRPAGMYQFTKQSLISSGCLSHKPSIKNIV